MSGRLGQLRERRDPDGAQTLFYVVASTKNWYHLLNVENGELTSFKKRVLDKPSGVGSWAWGDALCRWQPYWERIA